MESKLKNYGEKEVIDYSKFGWPLNASDTHMDNSIPTNQKGARANTDRLQQYIDNEVKNRSVIGPFAKNPFGKFARFNPVDTVPKRDSNDLRVIINLSHPFKGKSVNHSINKTRFGDKPMKLKYPSVDDLVAIIQQKAKKLGKNERVLMFKRDLTGAYRQFVMDPGDIHLLGYQINGLLYFDTVLSMGSASAAYCCQATTNAVTHIFHEEGFEDVNYLDDFGGAEVESLATQAFEVLGDILKSIGILESPKKAVPPSPIITFLGVEFDTIKNELRIPLDRVREIKLLLKKWLSTVPYSGFKQIPKVNVQSDRTRFITRTMFISDVA